MNNANLRAYDITLVGNRTVLAGRLGLLAA
jgi:hypothetical protein